MSKFGGYIASDHSIGATQKAVAVITNATDNTNAVIFTVTVPNAITNAFLDLTLCGAYSDGDGLDVKKYTIAISRVAGVTTVANIATAAVTGNNPSTGHTSMTFTLGSVVVTGAATATNTLSIRGKVAAGSSSVAGAVHFLGGTAEMLILTGNAQLSS